MIISNLNYLEPVSEVKEIAGASGKVNYAGIISQANVNSNSQLSGSGASGLGAVFNESGVSSSAGNSNGGGYFFFPTQGNSVYQNLFGF